MPVIPTIRLLFVIYSYYDEPYQHMWSIGGHICRYTRSRVRYGRPSIDGISSIEHMSQRILSPIANCKIRHSLTTSVCKSLIHGLVTSRLDYGNAMLFGIADRLLHRLEMVQRSAARVVMQIRRGDRQSMTTILQRLHWLPVKKRIEFKILVLVHKAIYEGQPVYLASLLNQHTPKRCLRSSSGLLLDVPRVNLERFGRRAFACAGPTLWNNLPISLRVNGNHTQFKKLLKTYLFST